MLIQLKTTIALIAFLIVCAACSGPNAAAPMSPAVTAAAPAASESTSALTRCSVTPFGTTPFPEPGLEAVPWVKAEPASANVVAHVFSVPGKAPETGQPLHTGKRKVLWRLDNPQRGADLEIEGTNLTTGTVFREMVKPADTPAWAYPSEIDLSASGCWQLDLKSGEIAAHIVFLVDAS